MYTLLVLVFIALLNIWYRRTIVLMGAIERKKLENEITKDDQHWQM